MARSYLSFTFALATASAMLFGVGATLVSAQPAQPEQERLIVRRQLRRGTPEVQDAANLVLGPTHDMVAAIKKLEDAARKNPKLPSAHVLMYSILSLQGVNQPAAARFQLEVAIKETPNDPEPYIILGNFAMQERRIWRGVAKAFEKANRYWPTTRTRTARILLQRADLERHCPGGGSPRGLERRRDSPPRSTEADE